MPTIEQAPTQIPEQSAIDAAKAQAEADTKYLEEVYQSGDIKTPEDQQALKELADENREQHILVNGEKVKAEIGKESVAAAARIAEQQMQDEKRGDQPDSWQMNQH